MNSLSVIHKQGIEFFRLSDLRTLNVDRYFDCLDLMRSLFEDPRFKNSTPGFYINYITNKRESGNDGGNSVRLTYFTIDAAETIMTIKDFEKNNSDKIRIYECKDTRRPNVNKITEECDEKLLRFRNFLNTYTQIALNLLENYGRLPTRKLITEYRLKHLQQNVPPNQFFETIFTKHSDYFVQLKDSFLANQFWQDLIRWDSHGFWLHFLVNMLLPNDLPYHISIKERFHKED